ncbi:hypothetical protein H2201_002755 [Coniosporium apollinis]|uniref:SH3 domain-containing protein n=1 Tax=Coniosporium apollinis TaxID=61459 RepID=A0ABQ9P116_9PEZI|nr:hypothetical protein H2201_002755 [Coniosporium apollinis]
MKLLQGNLDRLKSTLLLMLNVLAYAKKLKEEDPLAEEQRICIQRLIQVNQESTARLKQLEKFLSQQSSAAAAPSPDMQTAVLAPPTPPASNSSPVSSLGNTQCLCGRPFQADALHLTERDIAKRLFSINTVQKAIRDVQSLSSSDTSPTEEQVCSKFLKACRTGHDALRLFVESERAHTTKATGIDNAERLRQKAAFHEIGQQLRNTVFECGVDDIKTDAPPQFEKCIKEDSTGGKVPTRSGAVTTCIKWESIRKLAAKARLQTDDSITVPACSPNADWYQGPLRGLEGKAPSEHVQPLNHEHLVKVTCGFEDAEDGKLSAREGDIIRVLEDQGNWWKGSLKGQVGLFLANSTVQVDVQVAPTPKPPPTVPAVLGPNVEGSGENSPSSESAGDYLAKVANRYSVLRRCPPSKVTVGQPSVETIWDTSSSKPSVGSSRDGHRQQLRSILKSPVQERVPTPADTSSNSSKPMAAQVRASHSEHDEATAGTDLVDSLL